MQPYIKRQHFSELILLPDDASTKIISQLPHLILTVKEYNPNQSGPIFLNNFLSSPPKFQKYKIFHKKMPW